MTFRKIALPASRHVSEVPYKNTHEQTRINDVLRFHCGENGVDGAGRGGLRTQTVCRHPTTNVQNADSIWTKEAGRCLMRGLHRSDYINTVKTAAETRRKFNISAGNPKMPRRELSAHRRSNYGPRPSVRVVAPCGPLAGYKSCGQTHRPSADKMTLPATLPHLIYAQSLLFVCNQRVLC